MSVSGIGSLFENNHPFRALITFSLILAAIFEAINQAFALVEKSKRELRDKVKELEEVIENLKTSSQPRKRTESNSLKYWRSLLTIRMKNEMQAIPSRRDFQKSLRFFRPFLQINHRAFSRNTNRPAE